MILLRDKSFSTIEIDGYKQVDFKKDPNSVKNGQYIHGEETYIFEKDGQKYVFKTSDKNFKMEAMKAKLGNRQNFEKWARENIFKHLEPLESEEKEFSDIPKSSNADKAYAKWKQSKNPKDAKAFMDIWTKEVYVPARQKGIMVDPDPAVVHAANGIR